MTLRQSIERYQRVMATSDDPAHASIAAALSEILSDQIGGDAMTIDVEAELARLEVWMNVNRPSLLRDRVTTDMSNAEIHVNEIARDVWLAAKRDAKETP